MTNDTGSSAAPFKLAVTGDGLNVERHVDRDTAMQIIALAYGGSISADPAAPVSLSSANKHTRARPRPSTRRRQKSDDDAPSKPRRRKRSGNPGVVKDLSMRPSGKAPFTSLVEEKKPTTHQQKQAVIVYWLKHEAGMAQDITADHVNTCYLEAKWPRPADLDNALQATAAKRGG